MIGHQTRRILLASAAAGALLTTGGVAHAQEATEGAYGEIIVSARKRDETSISVPVVVTAVGGVELQRRAISNLDGIARLVPQLMIASHGGAVQGGVVSMRAISGPADNPFGDTAVSFNVDGVAIGKSSVRRMADFDLDQIEVLKGPQALFFGKNSPAGIMTLRTADPTDNLQGKVSVGYEAVAREWRAEAFVAGPLSETVGFRVAGIYSDMKGWLKNVTPASTYLAQWSPKRAPEQKSWGLRGTLTFEPSEAFDARLKLTYGKTQNDGGPAATNEVISCPYGARQTGSGGPCKPGKRQITTGVGGAAHDAVPNAFPSGYAFQDQSQMLGSLEMNYHLSDALTLTSVSGLYKTKLNQAGQYESDWAVALPSNNFLKQREFSQELRISSDFEGPLNFSGGLYYANTTASGGSVTLLYASDPLGAASFGLPLLFVIPINNYDLKQKGKAYSAYLQMSYKPVEQVEISVGGRYSKEKKRLAYARTRLDSVFPLTDADDQIRTGAISPNRKSWNDFSPEISISYRPTSKLTLFGSYKHGFLSGGFNSSAVDYTQSPDISYDQETVKGFEAGVKALLLDDTLRLNMAAYNYKVKGLQITNYVNATATIRNAGDAKIKGVEFDFNYRTPLQGLSINGAIAYNDAKYGKLGVGGPCYNGQTNDLGCTIGRYEDGQIVPDPTGNAIQILDGTRLPRAPKLNLSAGFNFDTEVGGNIKLGLSGNLTRSSGYLTDAASSPNGRQKGYTLLDGSIRLSDADEHYTFEVIGRNLTDKYYYVQTNDMPFTGSPAGGASSLNPANRLGDRYANVSRGREIMFRVTYRFGN
jgi:iron complex outermembrane receptor protein